MATPTSLPTPPYSNRDISTRVHLKAVGSATVDPVSLLTGAHTSGTIAVKGAALGDMVLASFSLDLQGMTLTAYVNDGDSVTWDIFNSTAGTLDLLSGTMRVFVLDAAQGVALD